VADQVDARVRVTCPRCGTIDVAVTEARLTAAADGDGSTTLAVDCPRCGTTCTTTVDARTAGLLLRADVALHAPNATLGRSSAPGDRRA